MTDSWTRTVPRQIRFVLIAGIAAFFLTSCETAPVPLSDQGVLDRTKILLPDTFPKGSPGYPRMVRVLQAMGFHWNDPRFTLGHHLIRENEVAWFDPEGTLHVTRYTGIFKETGYRIRRYVPSPSGDMEHRGYYVRPGILRCLFNRPAMALHWHRQVSSIDLIAEMGLGAPIDLLITPFSLPLCLFSDRRPSVFLHAKGEPDEETVQKAKELHRKSIQKGNPIPT